MELLLELLQIVTGAASNVHEENASSEVSEQLILNGVQVQGRLPLGDHGYHRHAEVLLELLVTGNVFEVDYIRTDIQLRGVLWRSIGILT